MPAAGTGEEAGNILRKVVGENEDLHELAAEDGPELLLLALYDEAYAGILLQKQGNRLRLIAGSSGKTPQLPSARTSGPLHPAALRPHPSGGPERLEGMSVQDEYGDIERPPLRPPGYSFILPFTWTPSMPPCLPSGSM